ncbi:thioredoxin-dependent thiol peroxidase [bacterium SCSIO 12643]|nr:thioredoxin-dependent thiol peroxidase [bacterium SCSIO 12643]
MTHLKEGDQAPDFTGIDQNEQQVKLSDFKGKKVILYFYPKDMTPGCTAQACNLGENYGALTEKGFVVIGVSADSVKRHQKFTEKYELPFILLADESKEIINSYGVWGMKKLYGREYEGIYRETFIIDENGVIEKIILKVKTKAHTEQILEVLGQ